MSKSDRYPETVWTRYREDWLPWLALAGLVVMGAGSAWGLPWLAIAGKALSTAVIVSIVPVLVFEYRADMRHDRLHPWTEEDEG